jgi:hypothetical protein
VQCHQTRCLIIRDGSDGGRVRGVQGTALGP